MKKEKKLLWIFFGLGITIGMLQWYFSSTDSESVNNTKMEIKIGYSPLMVNLPLMVAHEKGFFKEEGLKVKCEKMSTTNNLRDAVVNGNIQIAAALGTEMFLQNNIISEGLNYALYFNVLTNRKYQDGFIVLKDSPINSNADLNSKNVGCYPSSTILSYLTVIQQKNHIIFNTTTLNPTEALQLLDSKKVDAIFAIEPLLSNAINNGYKVISKANITKCIMDNLPVGVYAMNGDFYRKNKAVATSFQIAMDKAVEYIEKNQEEAIGIGEKILESPSGSMKNSILPMWSSGCNLDRGSFNMLISFFVTQEIISNNPETTDKQYSFIHCNESHD